MASKNLPIVDWLQIESSAPAKFIISGEYSVVYEKQAIAAAIDLRTTVTIRPGKDAKLRLNLKNLNCVREWPTSSLTTCRLVSKYSECLDYNDMCPGKLSYLLNARYIVNREQASTSRGSTPSTGDSTDKDWDKKATDAVTAFLLLYIGLGDSYCSSARPPLEVDIESTIPVGSGLGSSSAYSVALCGGLMRVFRVAAEKYIISNWAFNIDKFFHGRPSGVDNNVVSVGGYILFQNGKIKAHGSAHKTPIKVMLIDTGVSRSTRTLGENVLAQLRDNPAHVKEIFDNIHEITTQIWTKLNEPDFTPRNIADLLHRNQERLNTLGVGHEKLDDICMKAGQFNLSAKQTGAGGGGTAFVLYDDTDDCKNIEQLRKLLTDSGYHVHDHAVGCEGLSVKITPDPDKKFPIGDR